MKLDIRDGLPFVRATITYRGNSIDFTSLVVDTGSVGRVFPAGKLAQIGLTYAQDDQVRRIQGVGGVEFVVSKRVDRVSVDETAASDVEIQIGSVDYGFGIEGILGMNWLQVVGAVIDLAELELRTGA